jgi:TonB family protein
MRRCLITLLFALPAAALCFTLAAIPAITQTTDLEQQLRDQYQGKIFLLRGFYSGDQLRSGSTGLPDKASSGDWTTDGFVQVDDIDVSGQGLTIRAARLIVIAPNHSGFGFVADTPKGKKKAPSLDIKADLPSGGSSLEQVEAALSRIFLTAQDDLAAQVPDYWKPCVVEGLSGKNSKCRFSPKLAVVPGILTREQDSVTDNAPSPVASRVGQGVSPPRVIRQVDPKFSEAAERAKVNHAEVTLKLVVDQSGTPQNIHVATPFGCGLDLEAVRAVEAWRFDPSQKDGKPVKVEIAVAMEFLR